MNSKISLSLGTAGRSSLDCLADFLVSYFGVISDPQPSNEIGVDLSASENYPRTSSDSSLSPIYSIEDKMYHCQQCHFKTKRPSELLRHTRVHSGEPGQNLDKKENTQPRQQEKTPQTDDSGYISCPFCDYYSARRSDVRKHMQRHTGQFTSEGSAKPPTASQSEQCLQCEYCGFTAKHLKTLKMHMLRHADKILLCDQCNFKTHFPNDLEKHKVKHTYQVQPIIYCQLCIFKTMSAADLKEHMKEHSDEMLQCHLCGYETYTNRRMKDHMAIHSFEVLIS